MEHHQLHDRRTVRAAHAALTDEGESKTVLGRARRAYEILRIGARPDEAVQLRRAAARIASADPTDADDIADAVSDNPRDLLPVFAQVRGLIQRSDGNVVPRHGVWDVFCAEGGAVHVDLPDASGREVLRRVDPEEWVDGTREETQWVDLFARLIVVSPDGDVVSLEDERTFSVHPEPPECHGHHEDHDWHVVSKASEGAGVCVVESCVRCGAYMITRTQARRPDTGEYAGDWVRYEEPDDASMKAVKRDLLDGATWDDVAPPGKREYLRAARLVSARGEVLATHTIEFEVDAESGEAVQVDSWEDVEDERLDESDIEWLDLSWWGVP